MTIVFSNPSCTDEQRRTRCYDGHVITYPASPASLALIDHAQRLIAEASGYLLCRPSRTVNVDDVVNRREAPNFDSECTGTTVRDFLRAGDLQRIGEDVALAYESGMENGIAGKR
jgi:hypothetical protein